jgi:hypothetical protein
VTRVSGLEPGGVPDASASASPHDHGMASRRVELRVDVTVDGATITGQVATAGFDRPFSGRLGLIAAIEAALGPTDESDRPPPPASR